MKLVLTFLLGATIFLFSGCEWVEPPENETDPGNENESVYTEEELEAYIDERLEEKLVGIDTDVEPLEGRILDLVATYGDAVVGVFAVGSDIGLGGSASAVIYAEEDGRYKAVTNHHVVEDALELEIVYEKYGMLREIGAEDVELLGKDRTTDLAVLAFESEESFPTVSFADSYEVDVGQFAFAVGNPLGFDYFGTLTSGVISGLARYVPDSEYEVPFIQHDAALSPGNSGGALFNLEGELIGINNMKIASAEAGDIGFAIPSNTVERVVEELAAEGRMVRPFFGVVSYPAVADCGQEYGVCVEDVSDDSAAEAAGVEPGDVIVGYKLKEWDEYVDVYNFNDMRESILNSRIGDEMSVVLYRNGERVETDYVSLIPHPDDEEAE